MDAHQEHIDSLLQRYLVLLDDYTQLRARLSALQATVFRDIARANFSAERGLRYGQDQYDQRMQALRTLTIREEDGVPVFNIGQEGGQEASDESEGGNEKGKAEADGQKRDEDQDAAAEKEDKKAESEKKPVQKKDPIRWFGLLTPPALRTAQASSIESIEQVIPRLVSVNEEMARVEIEVRRARKKRAKAEAASASAGKDESKIAAAAGEGITAS